MKCGLANVEAITTRGKGREGNTEISRCFQVKICDNAFGLFSLLFTCIHFWLSGGREMNAAQCYGGVHFSVNGCRIWVCGIKQGVCCLPPFRSLDCRLACHDSYKRQIYLSRMSIGSEHPVDFSVFCICLFSLNDAVNYRGNCSYCQLLIFL